MKRINKRIGFILFLCLALSGCSTIMHGRSQVVRVGSNPGGAIVRVNNTETKTPGAITLDRTKKGYTLIFEKKGFSPITVELKRTYDDWLWGNIITAGIFGLAIDFLTGSAYRLKPSKVSVDFTE